VTTAASSPTSIDQATDREPDRADDRQSARRHPFHVVLARRHDDVVAAHTRRGLSARCLWTME
jgi:hypothetical protein